jgi:hypothetical protein
MFVNTKLFLEIPSVEVPVYSLRHWTPNIKQVIRKRKYSLEFYNAKPSVGLLAFL